MGAGVLRPMSAEFQQSTQEIVPTLGGLLYGKKSRPRVPETQWLDLLHAIAAGDTAALGTLYMWMHGAVFTLVLRISKDRVVAEELTVDVFQEVWQRAGEHDPARGTVVAWVMNLARAHALKVCKGSEA